MPPYLQAKLAMPPPKDPMENAAMMYSKPDEVDNLYVSMVWVCYSLCVCVASSIVDTVGRIMG